MCLAASSGKSPDNGAACLHIHLFPSLDFSSQAWEIDIFPAGFGEYGFAQSGVVMCLIWDLIWGEARYQPKLLIQGSDDSMGGARVSVSDHSTLELCDRRQFTEHL